MDVRRIVTGIGVDGAVVVTDDLVAPITVALMPGSEFHAVWGADGPQQLPSNGGRPVSFGWFPPATGCRFGLVTIGPDSAGLPAGFDLGAAIDEVAAKLPGMVEVLEPDHPGMHTTDTVDYTVILSGEIWLELDHRRETHLTAGDTVIQNGTRHAWRNKSDQPCTMAVALIGADRH
jgi:hypothetical protein